MNIHHAELQTYIISSIIHNVVIGACTNSNSLYLNMQLNTENVNRSRTTQQNNPGQTLTLKNLIGHFFWLIVFCKQDLASQ